MNAHTAVCPQKLHLTRQVEAGPAVLVAEVGVQPGQEEQPDHQAVLHAVRCSAEHTSTGDLLVQDCPHETCVAGSVSIVQHCRLALVHPAQCCRTQHTVTAALPHCLACVPRPAGLQKLAFRHHRLQLANTLVVSQTPM